MSRELTREKETGICLDMASIGKSLFVMQMNIIFRFKMQFRVYICTLGLLDYILCKYSLLVLRNSRISSKNRERKEDKGSQPAKCTNYDNSAYYGVKLFS